MGMTGINRDIKDLVVSSISNMVHMRINNIKSGWKTVFHILHTATLDHGGDNEAITTCAFTCIEKVIEVNYPLFVENLSDGVRTLLAFGQCKAVAAISVKSVSYLLQAAEYLADRTKSGQPVLLQSPISGLSNAIPGTAASAEVSANDALASNHPAAQWMPILRGLAMLVSDPRRDVRAAALNGVFDCLRDHGSAVFDEDTWRMAFNSVIKPLFDDIHHQLSGGDVQKSETNPGPPTCLAALTALVRLFEARLDSIAFLLDDVLRLIENCVQHDTEAVARIGVEGFKQLLLQTGKRLDAEAWQKVTTSILKLFNDSMPEKLMCSAVTMSTASQLPFRKEAVVIQCVVQLLLIDMLQEAVEHHYEHISTAGITTLLNALQRSFEFAQEFNQHIELRQTLKRLGFMREMKQLPGLLKQEREALSCSLKVLFQVQGDARLQGTPYVAQAVERLMGLCATVLRTYSAKERILQELRQTRPAQTSTHMGDRDREATAVEIEREVLGMVPIISDVVLRGLRDLDEAQFVRHATEFFPLLCELSVVSSREIRTLVRSLMVERLAPLVTLGVAASTSGNVPAVSAMGEEPTASTGDREKK